MTIESSTEESCPTNREEFSDKMAVLRKRANSKWKDLDLHLLTEWIKRLLFDPSKTWVVGLGLLLAEIVVNVLVIWKIKCEYFVSSWTGLLLDLSLFSNLVFPVLCDPLGHVHFVSICGS